MQFFKSMNIIRCLCMESAGKRMILFEMSPWEFTTNQLAQISLSDQFVWAQVVCWAWVESIGSCGLPDGSGLKTFLGGSGWPDWNKRIKYFSSPRPFFNRHFVDRYFVKTILSADFCGQTLRRQIFCRKILEEILLMFKSNNLPFIDLTKRVCGCRCGSECGWG
jgi:hypothetical protein